MHTWGEQKEYTIVDLQKANGISLISLNDVEIVVIERLTMNCNFGNQKSRDRYTRMSSSCTRFLFTVSTKFTISGKTRQRRDEDQDDTGTGKRPGGEGGGRNRGEETRERREWRIVQTAPVSNATTFPPKRNLKVGKPHVATPLAVNETRSHFQFSAALQHTALLFRIPRSFIEGTRSPFLMSFQTISIQIYPANKRSNSIFFLLLPRMLSTLTFRFPPLRSSRLCASDVVTISMLIIQRSSSISVTLVLNIKRTVTSF